jgi:hypothetical protein
MTPYLKKCINKQNKNIYQLLTTYKKYFTSVEINQQTKSLSEFYLKDKTYKTIHKGEEQYVFIKGDISISIDERKWNNKINFQDKSKDAPIKSIKIRAKKNSLYSYSFKMIKTIFKDKDSFSFEKIDYHTIFTFNKNKEKFVYSSNKKIKHQFLYDEKLFLFDNDITDISINKILKEKSLAENIKENLEFIFVGDFIGSKNENYLKTNKPILYTMKDLNIINISWVSNYKSVRTRRDIHKPSIYNLNKKGKLSNYMYLIGDDNKNEEMKKFINDNHIKVSKNFNWSKDDIYLAEINNLF